MASTLSADPQSRLVAALRRSLQAALKPAASGLAATVALIETHSAYVLIAGDTAYKLKKAVNLGFLDFTTLASRHHYCLEELRLNRRLAPELYQGVVAVTGSAGQPRFGGEGPAIEWALRMRAFPQDGLWDRLAARGALGPGPVDALAHALCAFHRVAAVAGADEAFGQPENVRAPMRDNFTALAAFGHDTGQGACLAELDGWEASAFDALRSVFAERARAGFVRECHGDLHLGNVTEFEGRTTMFDCLEFSPALRWTDVMSDVAFMAMDLHRHGLAGLAHRFVNACIEQSGDYAGLRVLRYYMVHRALVRAKVAALRAGQGAGDAEAVALRSAQQYLEVALACSRAAPPVLMVTHGFSGSGKTALTQSLLEACGAVRIRADVERKRLFGLDPLARSDPALRQRLYAEPATAATQARLRDAAVQALGGGFAVILDATFLSFEQRQQARALARSLSARFVMIDFVASQATLRERVQQRACRADDASEADLAVLESQLAHAQPLRSEERAEVYTFDAEAALDPPRMAARWAPLLRRLGLAPAHA